MYTLARTALFTAATSLLAAGCALTDSGDTASTSQSSPTGTVAGPTDTDTPSTQSPASDNEAATQGDSPALGAAIPPSPDATHDSRCDAIDVDSPGAFLTFPDPDAARSYHLDSGPVDLTVTGCANTFEATVIYALTLGTDEEPAITGHTMGGAYGEWAEFRFTETLAPGEWTILVGEQDAGTGELVYYDAVPVTVE